MSLKFLLPMPVTHTHLFFLSSFLVGKKEPKKPTLQLGLRLPSVIFFTGGITNSLRSDSVLPFSAEKNYLGCVVMGERRTTYFSIISTNQQSQKSFYFNIFCCVGIKAGKTAAQGGFFCYFSCPSRKVKEKSIIN